MTDLSARNDIAYKIAKDLNIAETALKIAGASNVENGKAIIENEEQLDKAIKFYCSKVKDISKSLRRS